VLLEIFTDEGVGTQVVPGAETRIRTALYATSVKKDGKGDTKGEAKA
jgi:acetylglutamate kinase